MDRRSASGRCLCTSCPRTSTWPEVGSSSRLIRRSVVVLPQPLGPSKATIFPGATSRLTLSTAAMWPANTLLTSRNSTAAPDIVFSREQNVAEPLLGIEKGRQHAKPMPLQEHLHGGPRVFVAVFGVNGLACFQPDFQVQGPQADGLGLRADKVHFDAAARRVEHSPMPERGDVEIGPQLAVDAHEEVEIERRRHALGIVVGRHQNRRIFAQVETQKHAVLRTQRVACAAKELSDFSFIEITDRRAQKDREARRSGLTLELSQPVAELPCQSDKAQSGVIL